jgi:hypothetical protein
MQRAIRRLKDPRPEVVVDAERTLDGAAHYAIAAASGVMGGWAFAFIWASLVPSSVQRQFWSGMAGVSKGMLVAEDTREFLALYRQLGASLLRYLGRNFGGLILGCLPLIALTFALSAWLFRPWDARAGGPSVYPPGAATLHPRDAGGPLLLTIRNAAEPIAIESRDPIRAAVCWDVPRCLLLQSLDFSVTTRRSVPIGANFSAIIVRPDYVSWNPLFPWLNDLEFLFFGMTPVGVAGAFLIRRRRQA